MIILIVLLVLFVFGVYLMNIETYNENWIFGVGTILTFTFGVYLVIHLIGFLLASYSYEKLVVKRTSFEQTLNDSRRNGNEYETAAIVKDVAEFNMSLASDKYDNNVFLLKDYVDDRVMLLEPIK